MESFLTIEPKHPLLRPHIAYYYFHQTFSKDFQRNFSYYPNYRVALNIFQQSAIRWQQTKRCTLPDTEAKPTAILTYSTQSKREVAMRGRINKIGIIFEPMGLNHFIDVPLNHLIIETINHFDYYGPTFWEMAKRVFNSTQLEEKRDLLDVFFLRHYQPFSIEEFSLIIRQILDENGGVKVDVLAKQLKISRKTLLRLFNRHLAHHIRGFSNLVKFRRTLQLFKQNRTKSNLTQLAYEGQYYDQAAFIKSIKAFTGLTPKQLFYQQTDIGGAHTFWTAGT